VNFELHSEAALEHEEQAAYYKTRSPTLAQRYNKAFKSAAARACEAPHRHRVVSPEGVRRLSLRGFPFAIYFFEFGGVVQIVAIAHHRKRPGYWLSRL
jgi:toxin ParE1/3/4